MHFDLLAQNQAHRRHSIKKKNVLVNLLKEFEYGQNLRNFDIENADTKFRPWKTDCSLCMSSNKMLTWLLHISLW